MVSRGASLAANFAAAAAALPVRLSWACRASCDFCRRSTAEASPPKADESKQGSIVDECTADEGR